MEAHFKVNQNQLDLLQAIINAREKIRTKDNISRHIDNKNLIAFLGNSNFKILIIFLKIKNIIQQ